MESVGCSFIILNFVLRDPARTFFPLGIHCRIFLNNKGRNIIVKKEKKEEKKKEENLESTDDEYCLFANEDEVYTCSLLAIMGISTILFSQKLHSIFLDI